MSQFYDQASLVMIPSGYKNGKVYSQKPLSTDGEITFSRASNATRVNSSGLVEKVRENVLLQSNTFNTTWVTTDASVTSGQSGYDGTSNAWLLNVTGGTGSQRIDQPIVLGGLNTYSVYLKAGTVNWVALRNTGSSSALVWFNLANGTKGANPNSALNYTITSVGSGWYRCTLTLNSTTDKVYIYPSTADNFAGLNCTSGDNILIQSAQLETGDIATDYIATTTSAVSVGPVSGLPRLDYSGGCPSLLLEPQRTNLALYSEQFDNAYWTKNRTTITANVSATLDPTGLNGADKIVETATSLFHGIERAFGTLSGSHSLSVFAKAAERNWVYIEFFTGSTSYTTFFNLSTGAIGTSAIGNNAKIEAYGNGWYRLSISRAAGAGTSFFVAGTASADNTASYVGDGTSGAYFWGAQIEAGAYASSYIPTLSTAVTRVDELAYKTGISSLIGQTEGTLFIDIEPQDISGGGRYFGIESASGPGSGWIAIISQGSTPNTFRFYGNAFDFTGGPALRGVRAKAALAYKNGVQTSAYVNGVSVGTLTENTTGASFATTKLAYGPFGNNGCCDFHQALIFPTALSNAQLAELTSL